MMQSNLPGLRSGAINFCWSYSKTYANVQEQIFDLIEAQLPPGTVSHSIEDAVAGAVNLSLFIRQGREPELHQRALDGHLRVHALA